WRFLGYEPADCSARGPVLEALVTDASDASGTAYFDPETGRYDLDLFRTAVGTAAREAHGAPATKSGPATEGGHAAVPGAASGVAPASAIILPRVLAAHEPAGRTTEGLLVGPGAADNAAAALGLGVASGDVVISIGT